MNNNQIIVILAPSCAGKDTIAKLISEKYNYNFVISTTSRPIRKNESQKNPYYFISKGDFEKLISNNLLIEYRTYNTLLNNKPDVWYYGVEKKEIKSELKYVCVLEMEGLRIFKKLFNDRIKSIYLHVDDDVRKKRNIGRGDFNEPEWNRRLIDDKKRFAKEIIENEVDFIIDADDNTENILNKISKKINF